MATMPPRSGAQYDMASMLIGAAEPTSTYCRGAHDGREGIKVLGSPTSDQSQLYSSFTASLSSSCNFTAGIQVAMLALKHQRIRKGRIILVVGSPH